jgi:hypothetical protein
VVVLDDRDAVLGEYCAHVVAHAAAEAVTGLAAAARRAADCAIVDNARSGERGAAGGGDEQPASLAVATVGTGAAGPALHAIAGDEGVNQRQVRAPRQTDEGPPFDTDAAAVAVAAVVARATGAADGRVAGDDAVADGGG